MVGRRSVIGFHVQGPLTPQQFSAIVDGAKRLHDAGKPLAGLVIVDEPGLVQAVKRVSPETLIVYRYVWSGDDPKPDLTKDPRGEALKDIERRWYKHAVEAAGAEWYQWNNEWWPKGNPQYAAAYYDAILDECWRRGVKTTVLDLYPGQPEIADLPYLYDMLRKAKRYGAVVVYHGYCPFNTDDMAAQAEWWSLRWMVFQQKYFPEDLKDLSVVIGETGNASGYLPDRTLALMQQYDRLLQPYPQVKFAAWYEIVNPALPTGWAAFDYSPMLPGYFDWSASL